jgi:hypothetical protein
VVQAGFGAYKGALTLVDAVCGECNQYFGDTIDRELLRDGAEGLERFRWGGRDPKHISKFGYKTLTLRAKDAGEFSEAQFRLSAGDGPDGLSAMLVPTVSFARKDGAGFVSYTESQLLKEEWRQNPDISWEKGVKAFGEGADISRLIAILASQGVKPTQTREITPPFSKGDELIVQQEFAITDEMYRALCKIAFNYLAYRTSSAFACDKAFDSIRTFIRTGKKPPLEPVLATDRSPFRLPAEDTDRPVVHFICIHGKHPEHNNLLGVVSLFGFLTYTVILAEDYLGPWPQPHAHLYNVKDKKVHAWPPGPFRPT